MNKVIEVKFFGEGVKFEHIGLVVDSFEKIKPNLGFEAQGEIGQKVNVAFISLYGIRIELLEPMGEDSPIAQSLAKGQKLLHICYTTPNLEISIREARKYGFICFKKPEPSSVFGNKLAAWLYSRTYGLFELIEA